MELGNITVALELRLPQLDTIAARLETLTGTLKDLGERMADALDPIHQSLDTLAGVVAQELTEIRDELARLQTANPSAEQIGAVVARIDGLATQVQNFVTPVEPPPPPA